MAKKAATKTTGQYMHTSSRRLNLPTEQTATTMSDADRQPILYKPETREIDHDPILAWNRRPADTDGHAAHPLYVREKVHPAAVVKLLEGTGEQPQLFSDFNGLPSADAAYEWYQHSANWSNRLIHGESARVMASLLARETMAGKVQMIYFDPPYGMGYKSNFQVSINQRDKTPEGAKGRPHDTRTIRAFRDTYERGVHSYLDLIREKLILMREMLTDTGSLFMQIGDENVLRVGLLLDEVFGAENRISLIPYATTSGSSAKTLPSVADFLMWYAKDKEQVKYRQLYEHLSRAEKVEQFLRNGGTRKRKSRQTRGLTRQASAKWCSPLPANETYSPGQRDAPNFWNEHRWPCPPVARVGRRDGSPRCTRRCSEGSALSWKR